MTDEQLSTDLTLAAETKLYYDLFAPNDGPAPLLVALHGYGSNKGWMMREARHHAPATFAVASLQGPHQHLKEAREPGGPLRYGFGWLTNFHPEDSIALHQRARSADVEVRAYDAAHEFVPSMRGDVRAWLSRRADS